MMEVELLIDRYANGFRQFAGQVVECSESDAAALIARGLARPATTFPELGVVETMTHEPTENAAMPRRKKGR